MTTAEHIRTIACSKTPQVTIAGVPWPLHKVVALAVALVVAIAVGVITMNAAPAVLAGAALGTLVWLAGGVRSHLGS